MKKLNKMIDWNKDDDCQKIAFLIWSKILNKWWQFSENDEQEQVVQITYIWEKYETRRKIPSILQMTKTLVDFYLLEIFLFIHSSM